MNDFYETHFENCNFCNCVSEDKNLTEDQKLKIIEDHTINAWADMVDRAWDEHKDREVV